MSQEIAAALIAATPPTVAALLGYLADGSTATYRQLRAVIVRGDF